MGEKVETSPIPSYNGRNSEVLDARSFAPLILPPDYIDPTGTRLAQKPAVERENTLRYRSQIYHHLSNLFQRASNNPNEFFQIGIQVNNIFSAYLAFDCTQRFITFGSSNEFNNLYDIPQEVLETAGGLFSTRILGNQNGYQISTESPTEHELRHLFKYEELGYDVRQAQVIIGVIMNEKGEMGLQVAMNPPAGMEIEHPLDFLEIILAPRRPSSHLFEQKPYEMKNDSLYDPTRYDMGKAERVFGRLTDLSPDDEQRKQQLYARYTAIKHIIERVASDPAKEDLFAKEYASYIMGGIQSPENKD